MAINTYLVPPGNPGFKQSVFKSAVQSTAGSDYSSIYYLAPTHKLLSSFKNIFHGITSGCYVPPVSMTLNQMSSRIIRKCGFASIVKGAVAPILISSISGHQTGYSKVLCDFIKEIKMLFPGIAPSEIQARIQSAFIDLNVPEDALNRAVSAMETFGKYQDALQMANAIDESDAITLSSSHCAELKIQTLILDGFYEITPSDEILIKSLISASINTYAIIPITYTDDDLTHCYSNFLAREFNITPENLPAKPPLPALNYAKASSKEDELESIARHIKASFISGANKSLETTHVIFPDINSYTETFERVFSRYGIPYELSRKPLLKTQRHLMELLNLLASISDGYPRLGFARAICSGVFKAIPQSLTTAMPQIALDATVLEGKDSWLRALSALKLHNEAKWLFNLLEPLEAQTCGMSEYSAILHNVLETLGFMQEEHHSDILRKAIQPLSVLDMFGIKMPMPSAFTDALRLMLDSPQTQLTSAGVQASDLFEARGIEAETVYIAGAKDGDLPSRPSLDYILPDSVRKSLGLVDLNRNLRLQERIFSRIANSASNIYITYPETEGDDLYLPSIYLTGTDADILNVRGIYSVQEKMLSGRVSHLHERIGEIQSLKGMYNKTGTISVTNIDAYMSCPRRFFIENKLKLKPPEILEYELEAKTTGIMAHRTLECLINKPCDSYGAYRRNAEDCLREILMEFDGDPYLSRLFAASFLEITEKIYEFEEGLREQGISLLHTEYPLSIVMQNGMTLTGKADRINKNTQADAVDIIDYKSGGYKLSGNGILQKGHPVQIPLYAWMVQKATGMRAQRAGVYSLKDLKMMWLPTKRDKSTLNDYMDKAEDVFLQATSGMLSGDFKASPIDDSICRKCGERPYCPYIKGGG